MYNLQFFRQGHRVRAFSLDAKAVTTVGRNSGNDVCFADIAVSRKQFSVECKDGKWIFRDLSGRGSYVNGILVNETELDDGAIIVFGGNIRAFFVGGEQVKHYDTTEIQYGV